MSKEKQQRDIIAHTPSSASSTATTASTASSFSIISGTEGAEEDEKITLFAPFEAQKPPRSLFHDSDDEILERSENRGPAKTRELEFQSSESQPPGNAKVIFRKLKAAVSGGSSASGTSSSNSLSASVSVPNKPSPLVQSSSSHQAKEPPNQPLTAGIGIRFQKGQRSSKSPTPSSESSSVSSSSTDPSAATGQDSRMSRNPKPAISVDQSMEPRISLTSYSDPHRPLGRQQLSGGGGGMAGGGSGASRSQTPAVNKSEMLKRFGSIADNQVQNSSADFKKYWMPDKACKECSECNVKFGIFVRRHHCRICGRIFCHTCCNITIPGAMLRPDLQGNLRVCKECCEIFTEFTNEKTLKLHQDKTKQSEKPSQPSDSLLSDHTPSSPHPSSLQVGMEPPQPMQGSGNFNRPRAVSRPVNVLSPSSKSWEEATSSGRSQLAEGGGAGGLMDMSPSRGANMEFDNPLTPTRRKTGGRKPISFDGLAAARQQRENAILDEDEVGLIASGIWSKFLDPSFGPTRMNRRYRLSKFPDSYTSAGIISWLLHNGHVASRAAGIQIGQALVDTKRLRIITSVDSEFKDETNQFLELGEAAMLPVEAGNSPVVRDAPKWFQHLPQESDSESESSNRERSPHAHASPYKPPFEHSVTLSSIHKITGSQESSDPTKETSRHKPTDDDYLVVDEELMGRSDTERDSSMPYSSPSPTLSLHATPPPPPPPTVVTPPIRAHSSPAAREGRKRRGASPTLKVRYLTKLGVVSSESPMGSLDGKVEVAEEALPSDEFSSTSTAAPVELEKKFLPKSYAEAESVFRRKYSEHFTTLMTQLIKSCGLSLSWLDIIRPLIIKATQSVRTDVFPDDIMDINEYVRVKKIPCGAKSDSALSHGVVCTKNVTHKKMCTEIINPTILLLKCAFDFQRKEGQLSSFDTLYLQENKYLQNLVDKVKAFRPSIILVQKSVSRLALEDLYNLGIVVVVNVKPSVMSRVARCTHAEIVTSMDKLVLDVRLGKCGKFYLRNFMLSSGIKKTLMYFDHCEPELGCVLTLQGGTNRELKKVKRVTQFGLHLAYNSLLESSFLLDEYAWPGAHSSLKSAGAGANEEGNSPEHPYSSTCSTPEYPLYPSLPEPLDALPPAEIIRRLEALGLNQNEKKTEAPPPIEPSHEEATSGETSEAPQVGSDEVRKDLSVELSAAENASESGQNLELNSESSATVLESEKSAQPSDSNVAKVEPASEGVQAESDSTAPTTTSEQTESDSHSTDTVTATSTVELRPDSVPEVVVPVTPDPETQLKMVSKDVLAKLSEKEFESAISDQIISISPNVKFTVPYLQTATGRDADVRQYLPSMIFWSYKFKPNSPKSRRNSCNGKSEVVEPELDEDPLEMGLTMKLVDDSVETTSKTDGGVATRRASSRSIHDRMTVTTPLHKHSYKSVSEHPLTSSLLLLKANTNEMKAALADFRSRAGLDMEDNVFFFKSAKVAADYRLHLQNVFNRYKQFERESEEAEEEPKEEVEEPDGAPPIVVTRSDGGKGERRKDPSATPPPGVGLELKRRSKQQWWNRRARGRSSSPAVAPPLTPRPNPPRMRKSHSPTPMPSFHERHFRKSSPASTGSQQEVEQEVTLSTSTSSQEQGIQQSLTPVQSTESTQTPSSKKMSPAASDISSSGGGGGWREGSGTRPHHAHSGTTGTLEDIDKTAQTLLEDRSALELGYEEIWLNSELQTDCLDPIKHQGISVLFSNTCHDKQKNHQRPCLSPCIIPMFYYGQNDIAIGDFLQRYCFREFYRCPTCAVDMAKHVRHIIHNNRAIHISVQTAENNLPGKEDNIYTWLSCVRCQNPTPYTRMSPNSLLFSFAKFIELKMYCDYYVARSEGGGGAVGGAGMCEHSLHKDYVHCFIYRNKLATFRPAEVQVLEVLLPPRTIHITTPTSQYHHSYATDIKHVSRIVEGVFYRIRQKLDKYRLEPVTSTINDYISNSKVERSALRTKVKYLKDLVISGGFIESKFEAPPTSPIKRKWPVGTATSTGGKVDDDVSCVQDGIADLKRAITEVVECWNILFEELDSKVREYRRRLRELGDVVMADGFSTQSPRDSPITTTIVSSAPVSTAAASSAQTITDSTITVTPRENLADESPPELITLISQSPELSNMESGDLPSHLYHSKGAEQESDGPEGGGKFPATPTNPSPQLNSRHERNFSDGLGGAKLGGDDLGHKRNLSDSSQVKSMELSTIQESLNHTVKSDSNLLTSQSVAPTSSSASLLRDESPTPKEDVEEGHDSNPTYTDGAKHEEGAAEKKSKDPKSEQYNGKKSNQLNGGSKEEKSGGAERSSGGQIEENPGGFLAKIRDMHIGREQGDDPTKFYLLDPYIITTGSPAPKPSVLSSSMAAGGSGTSEVGGGGVNGGGKGNLKKNVPGVKKTMAASGAPTGVDSHSESAHLPPPQPSKGDKKTLREKERTGILSRPFQKLPPPFEFCEHHTMHAHTTLPIAIYEREPTSIIAYALASRDYDAKLHMLREKSSAKQLPVVPSGGGLAEVKGQPNASPKLKRMNTESDKQAPQKRFFSELKKKGSAVAIGNIISGFMASTAPSTSGGENIDPFEESSDMHPRRLESTSSSSGMSSKSSGDGGVSEVSGLLPTLGVEEVDQGKAANRGHISLEFSNPEKTANFFCKVYFAEEFRKLRERIFPSGEDHFIRSLTRCVKYEAKGGKSRSAFCKVADDRFILKQIKSIEISAFEDFAPRYLDYVNRALEEKRPLALAKILGAYSIGFKNSKTGSSKRMDVVVMENLLYGRNFSRVFDLKGSMRSRYIDPSKDSSGDVLLDENYLNAICHDPVYVHSHSKFVLMQAIFADSAFLAQNSIMDYSLLTCIDNQTGMLVVGIIDYVRTFTFDKRLEMYLKKTSGRELPTVVYPEHYRKRFYEAMERYFTVVPDKWSGLGVDF